MGTDTFHSPLHRQRIDFLLAPTGRLEIAPGNARGNLALNEKALKGREKTLIVRPPSQGGAMRSNGDRHSPSLPPLSLWGQTLSTGQTLPLRGDRHSTGTDTPSRGDRHFLYLPVGAAMGAGCNGWRAMAAYGDRHSLPVGTDTMGAALWGLRWGQTLSTLFPLTLTSVNHP